MGEKIHFVCSVCLRADKELSLWVSKSTQLGSCSYCESKNLPVRSIKLVAQYMFGYINNVYEPRSPDAVWFGGIRLVSNIYTNTTRMLAEVFDYQGDAEYFASDYKLVSDMADELCQLVVVGTHEIAWYEKVIDPHGDVLISSWTFFVGEISHRQRFLFLTPTAKDDKLLLPRHSAQEILEIMANAIKDMNLVTTRESGEMIYRARISNGGAVFNNEKDLGAPDSKSAKAGRMNPPGIPYFYAATDTLTACAEVCGDSPEKLSIVYVSSWRTRNKLQFVDLTLLDMNTPSFFDENTIAKRAKHRFLQSFIFWVCKVLPENDAAQVAYIPAQVVSEYFRTVLKVDGVIFHSTKNRNGKCIVVFPSDECDQWPHPFIDKLKLCPPVEKKLVGTEPDLVIPKLTDENTPNPWAKLIVETQSKQSA